MSISVNKQPIEAFNFSGGECHISLGCMDITQETLVTAQLLNSDDIMRLLMTIDAIRQIAPDTLITLRIPYFPYARQDRVCNPGEAFSLSVMARLINQLECFEVQVFDPHSPRVQECLVRCIIVSQAEIIQNSKLTDFIQNNNMVLVAPDAGAAHKTQQLATALQVSALYATKERDTRSGEILKSAVTGVIPGQSYLIVDDICDGGRTFIELAKTLKAAGAGDLYLYVTHGIFARGLDCFKPFFKGVFCYHSFYEPSFVLGTDQAFLHNISS